MPMSREKAMVMGFLHAYQVSKQSIFFVLPLYICLIHQTTFLTLIDFFCGFHITHPDPANISVLTHLPSVHATSPEKKMKKKEKENGEDSVVEVAVWPFEPHSLPFSPFIFKCSLL